MSIDPQEFARMLGAEIVGQVPDVDGGPYGMARLAHVMHERLAPSRGERPGRPTNPNWAIRPKVPMSRATAQKLTELAEAMSTPARKVSPMQVAAQLLEEALARLAATAGGALEEGGNHAADSFSSAPVVAKSARPKLPEQGGKSPRRRKQA